MKYPSSLKKNTQNVQLVCSVLDALVWLGYVCFVVIVQTEWKVSSLSTIWPVRAKNKWFQQKTNSRWRGEDLYASILKTGPPFHLVYRKLFLIGIFMWIALLHFRRVCKHSLKDFLCVKMMEIPSAIRSISWPGEKGSHRTNDTRLQINHFPPPWRGGGKAGKRKVREWWPVLCWPLTKWEKFHCTHSILWNFISISGCIHLTL